MSNRSQNDNSDFPIDETTFREYYRSSTKAKLNWLEEINSFVAKTSDESAEDIRKNFREGNL